MNVDDDQFMAALQLADAVRELAGDSTPCMQNPDAWFPEKHDLVGPGSSSMSTLALAKELCLNNCPVLLQCRAYVLKHHEVEGIWGGLTGHERKVMRQAANRGQEKKSRKGIPNAKR